MKYIPGLNGLRAIAVFLVITYHWGLPDHPFFRSLQRFLPTGKFGVDIFFVISGFLISSILFAEKRAQALDGRSNGRIIRNFYFRRALRIFPIYYLTLCLLTFLKIPDFNPHLPWYLTYTENFHIYFRRNYDFFSHAWSLCVEEQFYLAWPFILVLVPARYLLTVIWIFIATGPVFNFLQVTAVPHHFNEFILTPGCFDALGIGALLAWYLHLGNMERIKKWTKRLLIPAIALFFYWKFAPGGGHFQYFRRTTDSVIGLAGILFCLSDRWKGWRSALLDNPVMFQLGAISYGLYLFHYPLPYLYAMVVYHIRPETVHQASALTYLIMYSILLALAFLSYYGVERPLLRLKKKFP